ncbi:hypothetical protein FQA39_LY11431 [Lamprigera yunnana]|nr:hypothetical protein FQA39_LY11431 [Lamprigera yunnana]
MAVCPIGNDANELENEAAINSDYESYSDVSGGEDKKWIPEQEGKNEIENITEPEEDKTWKVFYTKSSLYGKNKFKWSSEQLVSSRNRSKKYNIIIHLRGLRPITQTGNSAESLEGEFSFLVFMKRRGLLLNSLHSISGLGFCDSEEKQMSRLDDAWNAVKGWTEQGFMVLPAERAR